MPAHIGCRPVPTRVHAGSVTTGKLTWNLRSRARGSFHPRKRSGRAQIGNGVWLDLEATLDMGHWGYGHAYRDSDRDRTSKDCDRR